MATKKETIAETPATTKAPRKPSLPVSTDKRIIIKIERIPGQKEQDDVVIEVNGKRYQIQRGIEVAVPEEVAEAFKLWQKECADAEELMFQLMN